MDIRQFSQQIKAKRRELDDLFRRKMPVYAGRIAKDHYQDNFRKGGFVNRGLKKWPKSKRQESGGKSAGSNYGTLLSGRNHLFSSFKYVPGDARVKISNDLKYAPAHNFGETIDVTVTPKMRRYAWARYYEATGKGKKGGKGRKKASIAAMAEGDTPENKEAEFWKGLALTKKEKLRINMPERKIIGPSQELTDKINEKGDTEIRNILKL